MKAIVDCNSFYASCERLFKPILNGKPVVVLSNNDGCIVSRTDEAKALGIQMAGPYYQNKEVCPSPRVLWGVALTRRFLEVTKKVRNLSKKQPKVLLPSSHVA